MNTAPGDSGSPDWTETKNENGIITNTILAVHQTGSLPEIGNRYSTNRKDQCRNVATKVSQEIVRWIENEFELL